MKQGGRFEHVLEIVRTWRPDEVVVLESINMETEMLVVLRQFCWYCLGFRCYKKLCEWIYVSRETAELLKAVPSKKIDGGDVREYVKRKSMVLSKMIPKIAWRIMVSQC